MIAVGVAVLALWLLYVFYSAVMHFKRARDAGQMGWPMRALAYPALFVGLALDAASNITICTLIFIELPREWLVTARLKRHIKNGGWRGNLARWVCANLLDALDPSGCHCNTGDAQ